MNFDQMVKNLAVYLYQFIFPFREDNEQDLEKQIQKLAKINPGKTKTKQNRFKKKYIQIWKKILDLLCQHKLLRAHTKYVAHIQLFKNMNSYIEPCFQTDVFESDTQLSPLFYIQYFKLRNADVRERIHSIFLDRQRNQESRVADLIDAE